MRVLSAAEMREADRITIEDVGIPSIVLMENAGRQVVAALEQRFGDLTDYRVGVLCGRGNNGGDGLVVARILANDAVDVHAFLVGREQDLHGDAAGNLRIARRLDVPLVQIVEAPDAPTTESDDEVAESAPTLGWTDARGAVTGCDLLVDALLGTGVNQPLDGLLLEVVTDVNACGVPVVSVDLPSGLFADTAQPLGEAVEADVTVTLAAPKPALLLPPASAWTGDLVIADIGIPDVVIDELAGDRLELLTDDDVREVMGPRAVDAHKGDFGHVLVVAGSRGKTGAAALAGLGALRSGAGLVTIATPTGCVDTVAGFAPEYMTLPLPEEPTGTLAAEALDAILAQSGDVIALGPGLGATPAVAAVVAGVVARSTRPLVLDADALNALADNPGRLDAASVPIVVTPHPGEMARLAGTTTDDVQADRVGVARRFARDHGVTVMLKGAFTVVAEPSGAAWLNPTGNAGMATGGVGDVLTGVTAAWLSQVAQPRLAACAAAYLHGRAGDLAVGVGSETALVATDIVEHLGAAVVDVAHGSSPAPVDDPSDS